MAVPAYLRQQTKAKFITVATRLAAWTLKWCKDERLFTRRERWIVTGDLWTAAKGVLACAKKANLRRDFADAAQFAEREAYLRQAIRNRLLKDSDAEVALDRLGLQVPSGATFTAWLSFLRTLGEALVGSWAEYRQMLRDLPQQEGWPLAIQWPTAPGSEEDGERLHEQP